MKCATWMLSAFALLLCDIGRVKADLILDQSFSPNSSGGYTLGKTGNTYAQTFTVGVAGQLAEVDVDIYRRFATDNLIAQIVGTTNGVPNGTILASQSIAIASLPAGQSWVSFTNLPINVTVGEVLAIELSTGQGSSAVDWISQMGNP
jgi:hypothetical protein